MGKVSYSTGLKQNSTRGTSLGQLEILRFKLRASLGIVSEHMALGQLSLEQLWHKHSSNKSSLCVEKEGRSDEGIRAVPHNYVPLACLSRRVAWDTISHRAILYECKSEEEASMIPYSLASSLLENLF